MVQLSIIVRNHVQSLSVGKYYTGGVGGRGACMVGGHAWQGACMAGEGCVPGDTATAADGKHPTGMHALFWGFFGHSKAFFTSEFLYTYHCREVN